MTQADKIEENTSYKNCKINSSLIIKKYFIYRTTVHAYI